MSTSGGKRQRKGCASCELNLWKYITVDSQWIWATLEDCKIWAMLGNDCKKSIGVHWIRRRFSSPINCSAMLPIQAISSVNATSELLLVMTSLYISWDWHCWTHWQQYLFPLPSCKTNVSQQMRVNQFMQLKELIQLIPTHATQNNSHNLATQLSSLMIC